MGISNLRLGLENLHSTLRGDLRANEGELKSLEAATERMKDLFYACEELRSVIKAVEQVLRYDEPDWQPTLVAPRPKRKWTSLFKPGDRGRIALTILRENDGWMRPLDIATIMLEQIGHDPDDRIERTRLANTIAAYFKSHEGDLVESRGDYAKEWRVIRETRESR
jgi:hypothetical protein